MYVNYLLLPLLLSSCKLLTYAIIKMMQIAPLILHINHPIISLLKVKVAHKPKSKLYNYNKVLKCTNINFKITIYIITNILYILL